MADTGELCEGSGYQPIPEEVAPGDYRAMRPVCEGIIEISDFRNELVDHPKAEQPSVP